MVSNKVEGCLGQQPAPFQSGRSHGSGSGMTQGHSREGTGGEGVHGRTGGGGTAKRWGWLLTSSCCGGGVSQSADRAAGGRHCWGPELSRCGSARARGSAERAREGAEDRGDRALQVHVRQGRCACPRWLHSLVEGRMHASWVCSLRAVHACPARPKTAGCQPSAPTNLCCLSATHMDQCTSRPLPTPW